MNTVYRRINTDMYRDEHRYRMQDTKKSTRAPEHQSPEEMQDTGYKMQDARQG